MKLNFYSYLLLVICIISSGHLAAAPQIEVQGLFSGKAVVMIDGTRRILSEGQLSPEGVRMISADSKSAVLEINGEQRQFTLGTTVSTTYKKPELIREQIIANDRGMYLTYGSINGQSVQFLVDTGATVVAMSSLHAKQLGIQYRLDGQPARANTASGVAKAWRIQLKSVQVGQLKQNNVEAMVVDGTHPIHVLLGMSFLERLKVEKEGIKMVLQQKK